jgi:hypothetical protein
MLQLNSNSAASRSALLINGGICERKGERGREWVDWQGHYLTDRRKYDLLHLFENGSSNTAEAAQQQRHHRSLHM